MTPAALGAPDALGVGRGRKPLYGITHKGMAVTVLIAGPTEAVSAAIPDGIGVRRVETLSEARDALPEVNLVVVSCGFERGPDTLLGVVRSGVHCPAETPVIRLVDGSIDGVDELDDPPRRQSDFDAVVSADDPDAVRSALALGERAERYQDAVSDLYEACQARASGEEDVDVDDAFERASRAFEEVRDAAGRTPYEQLLGRSDGRVDSGDSVVDSGADEGEVTGDEAG